MDQQIRFCTSADGSRIGYAAYEEHPGLPIVYVSAWGEVLEPFWANPPGRLFVEVAGGA